MDAGHVNVILGEAEDKGLRGNINLVGGAKISFDFNGIGIETSFNCNTKNTYDWEWKYSSVYT